MRNETVTIDEAPANGEVSPATGPVMYATDGTKIDLSGVDAVITLPAGQASDAPATAAGMAPPAAAPAPQVKPEPRKFDIVEAVERRIASIEEWAENPEDAATAKVMRQRSVVARYVIALARLKAAEKQMKDRLEDEAGLLDTLERDAEHDVQAKRDQPELPFGEAGAAPATAPVTDPDAWRAVPLATVWAEVGGDQKIPVLLAEAGIVTMGDLADYSSREHARLTDIAGIGTAKAEQIESVTQKWHETRATAEAAAIVAGAPSPAAVRPLTDVLPAHDPGDAVAACYPHLLPQFASGKVPAIDRMLGDAAGNLYLVTSAPAGHADGVYALRRLLPGRGRAPTEPDNQYAGQVVTLAGVEYTIAGTDATVLVSDPGESPAAPEPAPEEKAAKRKRRERVIAAAV